MANKCPHEAEHRKKGVLECVDHEPLVTSVLVKEVSTNSENKHRNASADDDDSDERVPPGQLL